MKPQFKLNACYAFDSNACNAVDFSEYIYVLILRSMRNTFIAYSPRLEDYLNFNENGMTGGVLLLVLYDFVTWSEGSIIY